MLYISYIVIMVSVSVILHTIVKNSKTSKTGLNKKQVKITRAFKKNGITYY